MTPEALAALHARCFVVAPAPWSAASFAGLLAEPTVFVVVLPGGFALGRVAAGEGELLTLAVAPETRRRGLGRALVAGFEAEARRRAAVEAFLEVAETNVAARSLYANAGYEEKARRRGYYAQPMIAATTALVLRKPLLATGQ
jgi:ribosomal-protein-alanine N-acetyltransferase